MKKKIIATALFAISLISFPSLAQQPACTDACPQTKCEQPRQCHPAKCGQFEGLNLSEQQQAQLKELQQQRAEKLKANRDKNRKDKAICDSTARAERKQCRQNYLAKVKAILTPEQYVTFLENSFVNEAPRHKGAKFNKKDGKAPCDNRPYCKYPKKDKR